MVNPGRSPWRPGLKALLAGWVVLAASLVSCSGDGGLGPGIAARIDGRDVAYSKFESYVLEATGDPASGLDSSVLSALFEQFLEQELLHRLAVERDLIEPDASAEQAAQSLLEAAPQPSPDREQIARYYHEHAGDFERGERVLLRQILAQDVATAEAVRAELAAGASFDALAERYRDNDSAVFVDERGELMRSQLPVVFVEPIFALEAGETSEVLEADYGFHIFQIVEKKAPETLPLADVEASIRRRVEREQASQLLADFVDQARDRYNLMIAERNLPFALEFSD